jgi:hypothetical protein
MPALPQATSRYALLIDALSMRNISFSHTSPEVIAGTKTVTRRLGWLNLKPGTLLQPVLKVRGLKPGEKIRPLRAPVRVLAVRQERLDRMTSEPDYGMEECRREGFGDHATLRFPEAFIMMFCATHPPCRPDSVVTRIEFEFT